MNVATCFTPLDRRAHPGGRRLRIRVRGVTKGTLTTISAVEHVGALGLGEQRLDIPVALVAMNGIPETMRNLLIFVFFAGFLFQPATADSAPYYRPNEIELVTKEHRIFVKAAYWGETRREPGLIDVASMSNPSQSRTAELSETYEILQDVRVVSDKLWILGNRGGRIGGGEMLIYSLDTLELLDWVMCESEQELSPSGRFAVYQKAGKNRKWALAYPVTLLYDLWGTPERNRFDGKNVYLENASSAAGRPTHPPDAAAAQVYFASATPKWPGAGVPTRSEEVDWIQRLGSTHAHSYTWSEDERLVAFVVYHNFGAEDRSLEGLLLVVVELDSEGRPVKHHEIEVPDDHLSLKDEITFMGSSIRLVSVHARSLNRKFIWIPDPQPWQR